MTIEGNQKVKSDYIETGQVGDLSTAIMADLVDKPGAKPAFWELVEKIMSYLYNHSNPLVRQGMKELEQEAKDELDGTFNNFGASKDLSMRKICLVPNKLIMALIRIYGSSLPVSQKEFNRGMWTRYPKLRTTHQY